MGHQSNSKPLAPPNLDVYLKRRRAKRYGVTVGVLLMLAIMVGLDWTGHLLYSGSDMRRYHRQTFQVTRVVDGDTLDLDIADPSTSPPSRFTRVRLWGIDTPELARRDQEAEPFAQDATVFSTDAAVGQRVTVHLQPHRPRDRFGRLLAYVALPDGTVLNESLLIQGLAVADDRWPHDGLERYDLLEKQAQTAGRGMWNENE